MVTEEAAKECFVFSPLEEDPGGCSPAPKEAGFRAVHLSEGWFGCLITW